MSLKKMNFKIDNLINILILYIILINPFVILFVKGREIKFKGSQLDCFVDLKVGMLWMISIILFIIFLRKKEFKFDKIEKCIILFFIIITISTINSISPIVSFYGNYGRREGLLTFFSYVVIFVMTKRYLIINYKIIKIFLCLGAIMALYGILQFYELDYITYYFGWSGHSVGTIGNRNFLSTYLIIMLAISMSIYIFEGKILYLIFGNVYFGALICTLTRGGWVSLVIFSLIGLVFIIKRKIALKRALIIFMSFSVILFFLGVSSGDRIFSRLESVKDNIININDESGSGRIYIWKLVSKVIEKYPLFGTGPEGLESCINKEFKDEIMYWKMNYQAGFIDKAHNEMLNIAATTGIISLIIYIMVLFIILKGLIKEIDDDNIKILFIIIMAYIVQSMFNISVIAVAPIFWCILGISSRVSCRKDILSGKEIEL